MAINTYIRTTITGDCRHSRKGTQGRHKKVGEKRKPHSYTTETDMEFQVIKEKAAKAGMTVAAYVGMAAVLFEFRPFNY